MARTNIRGQILTLLKAAGYQKEDFEAQPGAYAYWYRMPSPDVDLKGLYALLAKKGIKVRYVPKSHDFGRPEIMGEIFTMEPLGKNGLHVRFHRTKADRMGMDLGRDEAQYYENKKDTNKNIEIFEDWGSSDMNIAVQSMQNYIDKYCGGKINPDTITDAAHHTAEFYHDAMGDNYEDAVHVLTRAYMIRNNFHKLLAPKESEGDKVEEASGSLKNAFNHAYNETNKTRTRLVNLEKRIDHFKFQGKPIPKELMAAYKDALRDNKEWYDREQELRAMMGEGKDLGEDKRLYNKFYEPVPEYYSAHVHVGKGGHIDWPTKKERMQFLTANNLPFKIEHSPYIGMIKIVVPQKYAKKLDRLLHFKESVQEARVFRSPSTPYNRWADYEWGIEFKNLNSYAETVDFLRKEGVDFKTSLELFGKRIYFKDPKLASFYSLREINSNEKNKKLKAAEKHIDNFVGNERKWAAWRKKKGHDIQAATPNVIQARPEETTEAFKSDKKLDPYGLGMKRAYQKGEVAYYSGLNPYKPESQESHDFERGYKNGQVSIKAYNKAGAKSGYRHTGESREESVEENRAIHSREIRKVLGPGKTYRSPPHTFYMHDLTPQEAEKRLKKAGFTNTVHATHSSGKHSVTAMMKESIQEMDAQGYKGVRDYPIELGGPEKTLKPGAIQKPEDAIKDALKIFKKSSKKNNTKNEAFSDPSGLFHAAKKGYGQKKRFEVSYINPKAQLLSQRYGTKRFKAYTENTVRRHFEKEYPQYKINSIEQIEESK